MQQLFSTFSVRYPSITEYKFGRPATDGNLLYETPVIWCYIFKVDLYNNVWTDGQNVWRVKLFQGIQGTITIFKGKKDILKEKAIPIRQSVDNSTSIYMSYKCVLAYMVLRLSAYANEPQ